jgi:hypothetical protein
VPATFLTTLNSFSTNIASPAAFNPANSNVVYTPPDSKWPRIQNWFFSVQRQLPKNTVLELSYNGNHSLRLPIIADYNQAAPNQPGQSLGVHGARADTDFRADHVALSGGRQPLQRSLGPRGAPFLERLVRSELVHLGERHGRFRAGARVFRGLLPGQSPEHSQPGRGKRASSFDVKLNNVTTVVYQLPFGKGRQFGSNMNPVARCVCGRMGNHSINTAHTGQPLDVTYGATGANIVSSLSNDYRGQPFLRPNVTGSKPSARAARPC